MAFSPDGTTLATAGIVPSPVGCVVSGPPTSGDMVKLWNVSTGALLHNIPAATGTMPTRPSSRPTARAW